MKKSNILYLLLVFILISCGDKTEKAAIKKENDSQTIIAFKQVNDSLTNTWNEMMKSDDMKFQDMKRLLDEISYTKKYDVITHSKLEKQLVEVKNKRFTQENMESAKIDEYDAATDSLVKELFNLTATTPDIKNHPLADELAQDINTANNATLIHFRVRYDKWAKQYNEFINKNKKELEGLKEAQPLKEKKIFEVPNS